MCLRIYKKFLKRNRRLKVAIMIWNEARECMSRDELMTLQGKRLVGMVKKVYHSVAYYRKKMQQTGIEPGDIRRIEDLDKLPFTTKEDLIQNSPPDFMAVSQSEIIRYHSSNATTGTEIIVGCTRNDVEVWAECVARCIYMAGLGRNDTIQIAYNYGLFTGGLGAHYGAEKVGAAVVPSSTCSIDRLIRIMKELRVTGMMCAPSYLLHIAQMIDNMGEAAHLNLRTAICGTETWSEKMRSNIERMLGIHTHDIYGFGEFAGLGVACDCECHNGLHVQEDYFVPEILQKNGNAAVKDGEKGELVFTTMRREGMPLIRYRTGDMTMITHERCQCGRTNARIGRLESKTDDTIVIRGVSVFRFELENMLAGLEHVRAKYMMRIYRESKLDMVDVLVAMEDLGRVLSKEEKELIKGSVIAAVRNIIGITPRVVFTSIETMLEMADRISTVVDERRYQK